MNTGLSDKNGYSVCTGDILYCEDGYYVLVYQDKEDKKFYGSLICAFGDSDSCRNIPYSLNNGHGYTIIYHLDMLRR